MKLVAETAILTFFFTQSALCDLYVRKSKVKTLTSCSLSGFSKHTSTESELRCKFACLQNVNCVARQWDAASGNYHIQDKLNIANSTSPEDTVSFMMGDKDIPVTSVIGCADILARDPSSESGVYTIIVGGQFLKQVWCDMDTDGGGWTVFLKRLDGSVDFYRDRAAYKEGFGDVNGEHWLGLDALHMLTSAKTYKLRVDVSDWEEDTAYRLLCMNPCLSQMSQNNTS